MYKRQEKKAKAEKPVKAEKPKKEPKPKKADKPAKAKKSKSSDAPHREAKQSKHKSGGKKSKNRDRNGLKENTAAGFGDSMPAFFGSGLK